MALRVRGRAAPATVALAAGVAEDEARRVLGAATDAGLVEGHGDRIALTPPGRTELTALLAREPIDRAALATLYDAFLVIDTSLKARVTAWQLQAPGRHADGGGAGALGVDGASAAALGAVRAAAADATAMARRLAAVVPRYAGYLRRLTAAADALAAGDVRFVASPRVDSLHQVWFELHQDLLVTLGRQRAA